MAEIEKRRAAEGLPMPPACPRDLIIDPAEGAPRAPGTAVRKKKRWTDDEIVEGLVRAMDELPPRAMLTQERLASIAVGRPDSPNWAAVHRSGKSWKTLKKLAQEARKAREAS